MFWYNKKKGLFGSGWWGKKRVGHVFIMNGALIQWIVYLNRAYCHFKPPLRLSSCFFFIVWV
jgi:hypothetical protein